MGAAQGRGRGAGPKAGSGARSRQLIRGAVDAVCGRSGATTKGGRSSWAAANWRLERLGGPDGGLAIEDRRPVVVRRTARPSGLRGHVGCKPALAAAEPPGARALDERARVTADYAPW
jgi:hypothetical protein